ncbi:MAG: PTS sugar transporter subunit IIA [Planctomycetota bacterium]
MDWYKRFKSKACILKLKASTKVDALGEVVDQLISSKLLEGDLEDAARKTLLEREELASTGVGMNVAIPHVKVDGLQEAICSLSVSPEGIEWRAVDGEPVHILFTVLRPGGATDQHDPEQHLEMMRWIARLARDPDFRGFALQARTKAELVGLLKEMSVA